MNADVTSLLRVGYDRLTAASYAAFNIVKIILQAVSFLMH